MCFVHKCKTQSTNCWNAGRSLREHFTASSVCCLERYCAPQADKYICAQYDRFPFCHYAVEFKLMRYGGPARSQLSLRQRFLRVVDLARMELDLSLWCTLAAIRAT